MTKVQKFDLGTIQIIDRDGNGKFNRGDQIVKQAFLGKEIELKFDSQEVKDFEKKYHLKLDPSRRFRLHAAQKFVNYQDQAYRHVVRGKVKEAREALSLAEAAAIKLDGETKSGAAATSQSIVKEAYQNAIETQLRRAEESVGQGNRPLEIDAARSYAEEAKKEFGIDIPLDENRIKGIELSYVNVRLKYMKDHPYNPKDVESDLNNVFTFAEARGIPTASYEPLRKSIIRSANLEWVLNQHALHEAKGHPFNPKDCLEKLGMSLNQAIKEGYLARATRSAEMGDKAGAYRALKKLEDEFPAFKFFSEKKDRVKAIRSLAVEQQAKNDAKVYLANGEFDQAKRVLNKARAELKSLKGWSLFGERPSSARDPFQDIWAEKYDLALERAHQYAMLGGTEQTKMILGKIKKFAEENGQTYNLVTHWREKELLETAAAHQPKKMKVSLKDSVDSFPYRKRLAILKKHVDSNGLRSTPPPTK